jgi:cation diffusion facilitator CzcD-associated flavoprotein CzcO
VGVTQNSDAPLDTIIAGCGFGGIAMAIALKKSGFDSFVIFERAADIGGVWRDNTYPGAACDVPSRLYSYSFEQDHSWSKQFAPQSEIHSYLKHCIAKYRLEPHIRLETEILSASFNEETGCWTIETGDGARYQAKAFISAVGLFNHPAIPDIAGRDDFKGPSFHSACWDHGCDLTGKTIAVIGTGASAIQFVPEIAKEAARLYVFQRTPQYVFPKGDRGGAPGAALSSWRAAITQRYRRLRIFMRFEQGTRRRASPKLTKEGEDNFLEHLRRAVPDAAFRDKLIPHYPLGCKRVLRSDHWYPALTRPNVELVDSPISRISPDGLETTDGTGRKVDAIIYGTGFTPTNYLTPMRITGIAGCDLNRSWRDGAEAYLGICVTGFPNFFMLYGPNTNLSGSIIYMLESEARYIARCLRTLRGKRARFMTVREAAQRRYNEAVQKRINATVLVDDSCHSYFRTATGKVTTQWPGYSTEFRLRTSRIKQSDFEFRE